jgi:hypothetical protein
MPDELDYRGRCYAIYKRYDPTRLAKVDKLLEKYKGKEHALIPALVNKYGEEPPFRPTNAPKAKVVKKVFRDQNNNVQGKGL